VELVMRGTTTEAFVAIPVKPALLMVSPRGRT